MKEAEIFQSSTGICLRLNPDFFMFSVESEEGEVVIITYNQGKFNL